MRGLTAQGLGFQCVFLCQESMSTLNCSQMSPVRLLASGGRMIPTLVGAGTIMEVSRDGPQALENKGRVGLLLYKALSMYSLFKRMILWAEISKVGKETQHRLRNTPGKPGLGQSHVDFRPLLLVRCCLLPKIQAFMQDHVLELQVRNSVQIRSC